MFGKANTSAGNRWPVFLQKCGIPVLPAFRDKPGSRISKGFLKNVYEFTGSH